MDLRRLQHLVALADTGHFGRAAERVHLSQPAFSRSIRAAEAELGMQLFDRGSTEATCTTAGRFVVERARRLLTENNRFARDLHLYRNHEIGELSVGLGQFTASQLLPTLLADLREHYPRVRVRVLVQSPSYFVAPLHREELDFFVGDARFAHRDDTLEVKEIGTIPGGFYVRRGHPLLARKPLRVADLAAHGLATGKLPALVQKGLMHLMGLREGDELPVAVECDDVLSLKAIALATDMVMIGTPALVAPELAGGTLVGLDFEDLPEPVSHFAIVSLRGRTFSPVATYAARFLERLMRAGPV
jgi:DNA-binding transcriptional LysR family regulator